MKTLWNGVIFTMQQCCKMTLSTISLKTVCIIVLFIYIVTLSFSALTLLVE